MRPIAELIPSILVPSWLALYAEPEARAWAAVTAARDHLARSPDDFNALAKFIRCANAHEEAVLRMANARKALTPPKSRVYR